MAGAGKKTFTAGEVLTASDTNQYLMEQTVMYFAGTASRASAIPTPSTGMTTYIGTTGTASIPQIETYTGSAWQTPYGLTQVANISIPSGSSTVQINNVFSASYDNYRVVGHFTSASAPFFVVKMRDGGGDLTNNYVNNVSSQSADNNHNNAVTSNMQPAFFNTNLMAFSFEVINPFLSVITSAFGFTYYNNSTDTWGAQYTPTTSLTGISLMPSSGTFTGGNIRIYGYRNS
jgi:hypothetical protein